MYQQKLEDLMKEKKELKLKITLARGEVGNEDDYRRLTDQINALREENENLQLKMNQLKNHV